jgi:uncharacterized membrane protein YeiH
LAGTFVFAIEGVLAAIAGGLDLLGVMVLSFVTALGGGITRDVLIATPPPQALRDWRYAAVAFIAGGLAFLLHPFAQQFPGPVLVTLDAAGLALFVVAGTEKALAYGIPPFIAIFVGTITAVGGGTIRDVLLAQIPAILRVDFYATAALAGAAVLVAGRGLKLPVRTMAVSGGLACFGLRLIAVWQHWHLPNATGF